jgi:membrane-bound lytic murein transglycosylase D
VLSEFDVDSSFIYNQSFDKFIIKHQKRLSRFYDNSLKRGSLIVSSIKRGLINNSLSDLLVYVSIIESGLSTDIKSYKKAVGVWQFMPATAKLYNLKITKCYDDRCDPYIATQTAIKHLKHLYRKFGKWYLAVLAYNCGEGRLAKAIKRAGSDELSILIDNKRRYLPKESREYIQKILLVAMIGESKDNYFEVTYPDIVKVEVASNCDLRDIAQLIGVESSLLLRLNAKYKQGITPDKGYSYKIVIPEAKMVEFYKKYQLPAKIIKKSFFTSYYVKLGDTLESISHKFDSSKEDIMLANGLEDEYLSVEQFLLIPTNKEP